MVSFLWLGSWITSELVNETVLVNILWFLFLFDLMDVLGWLEILLVAVSEHKFKIPVTISLYERLLEKYLVSDPHFCLINSILFSDPFIMFWCVPKFVIIGCCAPTVWNLIMCIFRLICSWGWWSWFLGFPILVCWLVTLMNLKDLFLVIIIDTLLVTHERCANKYLKIVIILRNWSSEFALNVFLLFQTVPFRLQLFASFEGSPMTSILFVEYFHPSDRPLESLIKLIIQIRQIFIIKYILFRLWPFWIHSTAIFDLLRCYCMNVTCWWLSRPLPLSLFVSWSLIKCQTFPLLNQFEFFDIWLWWAFDINRYFGWEKWLWCFHLHVTIYNLILNFIIVEN